MQVILQGKNTQICSMAVCGGDTKWEKAFLRSVANMALLFSGRVRDNISTIQRAKPN